MDTRSRAAPYPNAKGKAQDKSTRTAHYPQVGEKKRKEPPRDKHPGARSSLRGGGGKVFFSFRGEKSEKERKGLAD